MYSYRVDNKKINVSMYEMDREIAVRATYWSGRI